MDEGQRLSAIPRDVKGQKMTYTSKFLLTAPIPKWRRRRHDDGLQPGPKSMVYLAAYLLTQRSTRMSTCRAAVYPVTRQLVRQGTHRRVLYKVNLSFIQKYTHLAIQICTFSLYILWSSNLIVEEPFLKNSSSDRTHCSCVAARILLVDWLKLSSPP